MTPMTTDRRTEEPPEARVGGSLGRVTKSAETPGPEAGGRLHRQAGQNSDTVTNSDTVHAQYPTAACIHSATAVGALLDTWRCPMTKKLLGLLAVLLATTMIAAACSDDDTATTSGQDEPAAPTTDAPDPDPEPEPEPAPTSAPQDATAAPDEGLRIALVLPGSANDKGFNQLAFEALPHLESEFGAETAYAESTPVNEYVQAFEDFASDGYDIVIGQGFQFGEIAAEVAPNFGDVIFLVPNTTNLSGPNMQGIQPASHHGAYLAGVAAAMATESNQIGGIAGHAFPIIVAQMEAFALGVASVNADIDVTITYLGSFDDVEAGKETARAMISSGVDVVYHIADAAGIGVIQAAREDGVLAIGWGGDQTEIAPDTILTSQIVNQTILVVESVRAVVDGSFDGQQRLMGLDTPVLGLAPIRVVDNAAEIEAAVEAAKAGIIDGSLEVPFIAEPSS